MNGAAGVLEHGRHCGAPTTSDLSRISICGGPPSTLVRLVLQAIEHRRAHADILIEQVVDLRLNVGGTGTRRGDQRLECGDLGGASCFGVRFGKRNAVLRKIQFVGDDGRAMRQYAFDKERQL